jgi:hypothetical protein
VTSNLHQVCKSSIAYCAVGVLAELSACLIDHADSSDRKLVKIRDRSYPVGQKFRLWRLIHEAGSFGVVVVFLENSAAES